MALNGRIQNNQYYLAEGAEKKIASAKIDEILLEAIEALEHTRTLHESTPNPETKRQTKRILDSLHSSLLKLAPLGVHSVTRLEQIQRID